MPKPSQKGSGSHSNIEIPDPACVFDVAGIWSAIKQGQREAKAEAERRNKLLDYSAEHFDNCSRSPKEFYEAVLHNIDWRKVPDLRPGYVLMHQGNAFTKQRLYLQFKRERLVFEICAAPFGTGYFVSSRLFDRRHEANIFTFILLIALVGVIAFGLFYEFDAVVSFVTVGTLIASGWSIMRYAADSAVTWLDERISELPVVGPIYETFFHPDTYFRQDSNTMYKIVVNKAFGEAVSELKNRKGVKQEVSITAPEIQDLHER